uniref:Uncharacterized protein n=1 Tax=Arundo donax TaxID=35708 RepID=A0A0A9GUS4_ARUDO
MAPYLVLQDPGRQQQVSHQSPDISLTPVSSCPSPPCYIKRRSSSPCCSNHRYPPPPHLRAGGR